MSRPKRESTHYNLLSDARKLAAERVDFSVDHARVFALYVCLHHNNLVVKKDGKSEKTAEAPPLLAREILEMIMSHFGYSVFDVLEARQREVFFVNVKELGSKEKFARQLMFKAFPGIGAMDQGYRYHDMMDMSSYKNGRLSVFVEQRVRMDTSKKGESLLWNVFVDLNKVFLSEKRGSTIDVPETAIIVYTNVRKLKEYLKLSDARVQEMVSFRLKGEIRDAGRLIRFKSTSKGVDSDLGFDVVIGTPYVSGRQLDAHAGFAVGDRVLLEKCYKAYEAFAVGREGVIRDIRMYSFAVYFVEFGDEDESISKQVIQAHKKRPGLTLMHEGQLEHHVGCQWFHIKMVCGGAGGVGSAP